MFVKKATGECLILGHITYRNYEEKVRFPCNIICAHDLRCAPNRLLETINYVRAIALQCNGREHEHRPPDSSWRDYRYISLNYTGVPQPLQSALTGGGGKAGDFAQLFCREAIVVLDGVEKLPIDFIEFHLRYLQETGLRAENLR